jgi:exosortase
LSVRIESPNRIKRPAENMTTLALSSASRMWLSRSWPLLIGIFAIVLPTLHYIATDNWTTEQGSHGPLVMASGLWLLVKQWPQSYPLHERPTMWKAIGLLIPLCLLYIFARITAIVEIEGFLMYGILLVALYAHIGLRALQKLWFPLFYLMFVLPLPETFVSMLTNPLKIWISSTAVNVLYYFGYPIASAGVTIQIGQYQLLVAAACTGLNSLITLTALTLFYVYISHKADWKYMVLLIAAALPVAVFSNLVRVFLLILITYHGGEAAAQGFLHNFAGMTTFAVALGTIYLIDTLCQQFIQRRSKA